MTHVQALVKLKSKHGDWFVAPDLRPRLVADAVANGTNLTDQAIRVLADQFKVKLPESNARRADPGVDADVLHLMIPHALAVAIKRRAATTGRRWTDEIRRAISAYYGLQVPVPPSRPRRPRVAA